MSKSTKIPKQEESALSIMANTLVEILDGRQIYKRPVMSLAKSFGVTAGFIRRHTEQINAYMLYSQAREIYETATERNLPLNVLLYEAVVYYREHAPRSRPATSLKEYITNQLQMDTAAKPE